MFFGLFSSYSFSKFKKNCVTVEIIIVECVNTMKKIIIMDYNHERELSGSSKLHDVIFTVVSQKNYNQDSFPSRIFRKVHYNNLNNKGLL